MRLNIMQSVLWYIDDQGPDPWVQAALDVTRAVEGHLSCLHVSSLNSFKISDAYPRRAALPARSVSSLPRYTVCALLCGCL